MAIQGVVNTDDLLQQHVVIDMSDLIAELEPDVAPLAVILMKAAKQNATNSKIEWLEQRPRAAWTQINNVGGYLADATEIVVDDSSSIAIGDNVKIARTGEILRVTANALDTNTLTVARAFGETPAAAIEDKDWVLCLGNSSTESATAPIAVTTNPEPMYNFTEIIRTPCKISKTTAATKLYGGLTARQARQKQIMLDHRKQIEYKILFGERKQDLTGTDPVRTTRGLLKWLTANNKDVSGAEGVLTEYEFDKWTENLFRYGGSKRLLVASARLLTVINSWAKNKLEVVRDDSTYGVTVTRYITPHGELNMIKHKLLENAYSGYGFALDLSNIKYRPLVYGGENRDTKLLMNRQPNDADYYLDEYLTEFGMEVRLPETHGVLIGVNA